MQKIVDGLIRENDGRKVPDDLQNGGQWIEAIAATGCDAVGLDWTIDIADAKRRVGDKVALQGNMDPSMPYGTPERIREEVQHILAGFGEGEAMCSTWATVLLQMSIRNAGLINAVHEFSRQYHQK